MKLTVEVCKLIRQVVGIRYDVEFFLTKPLLHLDYISTKSILPCQLKTVGKVIDLLIFVKVVINVLLV